MAQFFSKRNIIIIIIIIAAVVGGIIYFNTGGGKPYEFITAELSDLMQEVSVTGQVEPAESVKLAFERGGKVGRVYVKTGDSVVAGQVLATLINGELVAQVMQAQANLEAEQAKLNELKIGTRAEEVSQAETTLANAEKDLKVAKEQADADLESDYSGALSASQSAAVKAKNAILTLTVIQNDHFGGSDQNSLAVASAKADAVFSLLGVSNGGRLTEEQTSTAMGGAFGSVQNAVQNPAHENIDLALNKIFRALQDVKEMLDATPLSTDLSAADKTSLVTEKGYINTEITTIAEKIQAIAVQKATNDSNIASAEAVVNSAKSNLAIKRAGSTAEQIAAQEAKVKSARASVTNNQAQLDKTIIRSPIKGVITKQDVKPGEIVAANIELVSVISEAQFEIKTNMPEADISKITVNDPARVTLDAYGSDEKFSAKVVSIDPAETIIEGVSTYKVTLQFENENGRIKSGMTANVDILTANVSNVIAVPQRAIIAKENKKYARILNNDETISEVEVETGLRGSDGRIEIKKGLNVGDKVITMMK